MLPHGTYMNGFLKIVCKLNFFQLTIFQILSLRIMYVWIENFNQDRLKIPSSLSQKIKGK